jgi:hypothetical protein
MSLTAFGADVVIQKATTGEVDWGKAVVSGALGVVGGGVGMAVTKSASFIVGKMVASQAARSVGSKTPSQQKPGHSRVGGNWNGSGNDQER